MKKIMAVFVLLVLGAVAAAVWYSPFSGKSAIEYVNNVAVSSVDGLCYSDGVCVRYDFGGDESDMYSALADIRAKTVRTAQAGNVLIVYAYSDRVCGERALSDGTVYNVMAAFRDGEIAIGAPMLQGSY